MIFGTRKVCFSHSPSYLKLTFKCHILHEYVLLVLTFDAVAIYFHLYADCILFFVNITTLERSYNKTHPSFS